MTAQGAPAIDVVVARYRESVSWLRKTPHALRLFVYDKGGDLAAADASRAEIVPLPNVGREAHTYLTHIVRHYHELAPLNVFCQGKPFDHVPEFHRVLRELAAGAPVPGGFRWLGFIVDTDDPRGRRLFVSWSKNQNRRELALDRFYLKLFGAPCPERVRFYPGANFVVSRERIQSRPESFFQKALELAETFPDAAHCFERVWDAMFGVVGVDAALLSGRDTVYLRPVKRLTGAPS